MMVTMMESSDGACPNSTMNLNNKTMIGTTASSLSTSTSTTTSTISSLLKTSALTTTQTSITSRTSTSTTTITTTTTKTSSKTHHRPYLSVTRTPPSTDKPIEDRQKIVIASSTPITTKTSSAHISISAPTTPNISSTSNAYQYSTTNQRRRTSSIAMSSVSGIIGGGGGSGGGSGGVTGSGNNGNGPGTFVQVGPIDVSKSLQDGDKFVKWDEDSGSGTPVTMRVDPKGFYLCWVDQNNETDLLDIATIRDVRTGQYAKKPRDSKLRQIVTLGTQDTLEEKTVTVCFGSDFVNVSFINFCATRKEIAQYWTDELIRLAYNLTQMNGSVTTFLQKAHTKLCLQIDKTGKIPVKNIIKQLATNKDDRRRVEKALDVSGLPSGKGDTLPLSKFQFEDFFNLYKNLTQRTEVDKIFDEIVGTSKRRLMSTSQLVDFLNKTQRDPRLNEILYPYANPARAKEIIFQYEPNKFNAQKGQLSLDGFMRYLMSDDNPIMALSKLDLCDDMEHPMSHYFINSSHNTYLTGHQLTGKSSVEIYRQSLLAGCRCVELDLWNGRTDEPMIVHGYTFVPEIFAKDVLEAIAESAFKTSEFPVILSFENHCNPRQQAKIAKYCRDIFGDMLLDKPLESYPLETNTELPPPSMLKRKIIIKNKKKHHHHHHHHHHHKKNATPVNVTNSNTVPAITNQQSVAEDETVQPVQTGNGDVVHHAPPLQQVRQSSKESTGSSDTDSSSDDESVAAVTSAQVVSGVIQPDKAAQTKETEAGAEISALVNYVQPVHFSSFENSEKKNRCYEMSSFDEKQATTLLKERPIEFVNYNKHQLSRVYPAGTRFDSSNFMPQLFWNAGCQLVALNYQTLDLAMQLNLGIFEYNQRCGFLLKPEFMRRKDRRLDPFAESTVDGIIAGTVSITVLSGQFLSDKKIGTYVEVDMFGLPADTVRKKFRTKCVRDNGINPVYDEEPFVFKKVVLPELASIRIAAYEENGKFIGHRVLTVIGLCPGYRHVTLRTELGQPIPLATLFLCIVVKDYVPHGLCDLAEALANPIKYQSELEKRTVQLAVFDDAALPAIEAADGTLVCQKKDLGKLDAMGGSPKHRGSIGAATSLSIDASSMSDVNCDNSGGGGGAGGAGVSVAAGSTSRSIQHQQSVTASTGTAKIVPEVKVIIVAEPLEMILDNKLVREKRLELEKKLDSMRKKHDKEKVRVSVQKGGDLADGIRKPKFYMNNKLVKRLSNKNMDLSVPIPQCPADLNDDSDGDLSDRPGVTRSQSERLLSVCREFSTSCQEIQEKYHDVIYGTAEKVLRNSQANQMKQLKTMLEKDTNDVMRELNEARRKEVKDLAIKHKDRDELVRRKREVASSLVQRGVTERVRVAQEYEKKREELQHEHELVRTALIEHKSKAKAILDKEAESRLCLSSEGFLVLFDWTTAAATAATAAAAAVAAAATTTTTTTTTTPVTSTSTADLLTTTQITETSLTSSSTLLSTTISSSTSTTTTTDTQSANNAVNISNSTTAAMQFES